MSVIRSNHGVTQEARDDVEFWHCVLRTPNSLFVRLVRSLRLLSVLVMAAISAATVKIMPQETWPHGRARNPLSMKKGSPAGRGLQ